MYRLNWVFCLGILMLVFTSQVNAKEYHFDIPSQNVETALFEFASIVDAFLLFPYDKVQPVKSNTLQGRYGLNEALAILLKGTGLSGTLTKRGVIAISQLDSVSKHQGKYMKKTKIAAAVLSALGASNAIAQDNGLQLEEVIVTAQKRAENAQEVPISISTLGKENLDAIFDGGADIRSIGVRVPSVYAEGSSGRTAPRFYIRGLGNTDFDLKASQPVSIIMDDVVMENVLLKGFPLFDVERVEVLRGPQGTLFGRNTPAGIIKFDTIKPTQEFDLDASLSYGTYDSSMAQFAIGGGLSDSVSARFAVQNNYRSDFVRNANSNADFAGNGDSEDDLGGFNDLALRTHLLFEPNDEWTSLLTLQYRDLDATTTLFRANILDQGSNDINERFDRETVFYDGGANNPSNVEQYGATFKSEYDFDVMTLTSITAYMNGSSNGRSDVDGGVLGDPDSSGFIPFPSDTGTLDTDLDQITQELRLSGETDGGLKWQSGLFYFTDEFTVDTVAFNGVGGSEPTILTRTTQETDAWAIFGQLSYDIGEKFNITSGIRYSDDQKDFVGSRSIGFLGPIEDVTTEVDDSHVSWDISASYFVADDTTLYTRVANGFRGPSIQGNLLFNNNITTAESETVNSIEFGVKSEFFDNRVRLNGAIFYYEVDDQQFTAIGGDANNNRLVNADKGVGQGIELDGEFLATENLLLTLGFSYNDTEIQDSSLLSRGCGAPCTITDAPATDANGVSGFRVDGNPFPSAPKTTFSFTAKYTIPMDSGEFFAFTDWAYQGETNFFLYESEEFNSDGNFEGGLRLGYESYDDNYSVALFGRNITDEENLLGGIDFNNLTGFVNDGRIWGIEASYNL